MDGVDHPGGRNDGGPVLVIVKDGNIHQFAQALFDDETLRRLDVFEIDAAEGWSEIANSIDELFGVFRTHLQIDGIDVREAFEQDGFSFHDRLGRQGSQIAQAQNGCAIGDDGDKIAFDRVVVSFGRIFGDGVDGHRDAWRIGQRQVALGRHGLCRRNLELSGPSSRMELQRFLIGESLSFAAARLGVGHHAISVRL